MKQILVSLASISSLLTVLLFLWLYIFLPMKMAKKRGRSKLGWVLLFWLISPLWGTILLLVLGDSKEKIIEDLAEEFQRNGEAD